MRVNTGVTVVLGLSLLGGCGSTNLFSTSALDLFSTSSKATTGGAETGPGPATDVECPEIKVRSGAATLMIGSKPGEGEPSAVDLRYQATIVRTARECQVNSGLMMMKVGIEGRVITGPAGGPGTIHVPLRIAVVHDGINPKTIVSKLARVQVTVASAVDRVPFTHIDLKLDSRCRSPWRISMLMRFMSASTRWARSRKKRNRQSSRSQDRLRNRVKAERKLPATQINNRALESADLKIIVRARRLR